MSPTKKGTDLDTESHDDSAVIDADQLAVKNAVESAFGAGAFDLLADDNDSAPGSLEAETSDRPKAADKLEALIAELDAESSPLENPATAGQGVTAVPATLVREAKLVEFLLGDVSYAVPMSNVLEIQRIPPVTSIPNVPEWVQGVCSLRGEIISVVDLCCLLGLESRGFAQSRRIMVVRSCKQDLTTGLIVDRVLGIRNLVDEQVRKPTAPVNDRVTTYLRGVVDLSDRLLAVLDLDRLLASEEMRQFEAV